MGAWRVANHQVKALVYDVKNITLIMWTWTFRREKVATDGIMATCKKSITDNAGKFASDKNFHNCCLMIVGRRETTIFRFVSDFLR